jgi:hypothetical protein
MVTGPQAIITRLNGPSVKSNENRNRYPSRRNPMKVTEACKVPPTMTPMAIEYAPNREESRYTEAITEMLNSKGDAAARKNDRWLCSTPP